MLRRLFCFSQIVEQLSYYRRRPLKLFLKVSGGPGELRLKEWWPTLRFTRSRGGLPLKMCVFRFDCGMVKKIGLSQFIWLRNSQIDYPTAMRDLLTTQGIIRCPFDICATF